MNNLMLEVEQRDGFTPVSDLFIDFYMPKAKPVYSIVYIYGLKHSEGGKAEMTVAQTKEDIGISAEIVMKAWFYWEKQGLIEIDDDGQAQSFTVKFLPIGAPAEKIQNVQHIQQVPVTQEIQKPSQIMQLPTRNTVTTPRPLYTTEELEIYKKQSEEIKNLFEHAERETGRLLNAGDLNVLFGLYDWLRLPLDVIEFLITYCCEREHRDFRYIEKVGLDWSENGLDTVEKAQSHVSVFNRDYKPIMLAIGGGSNPPTPSQKRFMDKWLEEYGMSVEMILEACDLTAVQIGKPKITYIDKIISEWHKNGIKTVEGVKNEGIKRLAKPVSAPAVKSERKNRFNNFKHKEIDYAKIEEMELMLLKQQIKG